MANKLSLFAKTIWNRTTYREITEIIERCKPDVVHCHNTFPLISPSVYWAATRQGVPVVQTLHNYRLICINPYLYRNGRICEDCLGRSPIRGVIHRCYRGSLAASFTVAAMLMIHRLLGTYRNKVTSYIALTEFGRQKFLEARLCDPSKVVVKPNAVAAEAAPAEALAASGQRLGSEDAEGSGFRVQEQRLAASGQRLEEEKSLGSSSSAPCATEDKSYQVLANTEDRLNDSPQGLAPSRYPLAPATTPTHSHTHTLSSPSLAPSRYSLAAEHGCGKPATVLYAGRLSPEKGPYLLLEAWKLFIAKWFEIQVALPDVNNGESIGDDISDQKSKIKNQKSPLPRLIISGDGPERAALEAMAKGIPNVSFIGRLSLSDLHTHMASADVLVLPSTCYETFAMSVNEAAALGTPSIVSNIGGQASIVEDGVTGFTFRSGSAESLAETLAKALADPARLAEMGHHAQARFLASDCPPERNVAALCQTYAHAVGVNVCPPSGHTQVNT